VSQVNVSVFFVLFLDFLVSLYFDGPFNTLCWL